jgi:hypothetical protein
MLASMPSIPQIAKLAADIRSACLNVNRSRRAQVLVILSNPGLFHFSLSIERFRCLALSGRHGGFSAFEGAF